MQAGHSPVLVSAALIILAAWLAAATPSAVAADAKPVVTVPAAINKAGRQRMLSQRMAKAYLMVALGVEPDQGRGILSESISTFDAQLAELKAFASTEETRAAVASLEKEWKPYRTLLQGKPDAAGAAEVYALSETTLDAAHRLTLACERLSGEPSARVILISGRERMLSQRLAKFHLFMVANINTPAARLEFKMTRSEFSQGLSQLANSPFTTPAIKTRLKQVHEEWQAYDRVLASTGTEARKNALDVALRSERILELLEGVVTAYEAAAP